MNYWIIVNGQQQGPFSIEALKGMAITPSTQVWTEGMPNWVSANTVPELASVISTTPPPLNYGANNYSGAQSYQQPYQQSGAQHGSNCPSKPETYLVWAILVTIFCCIAGGIVAIIQANKVDSCYNVGDYEGAKKASESAKTWIIVSAVIGFFGSIVYVLAGLA